MAYGLLNIDIELVIIINSLYFIVHIMKYSSATSVSILIISLGPIMRFKLIPSLHFNFLILKKDLYNKCLCWCALVLPSV